MYCPFKYKERNFASWIRILIRFVGRVFQRIENWFLMILDFCEKLKFLLLFLVDFQFPIFISLLVFFFQFYNFIFLLIIYSFQIPDFSCLMTKIGIRQLWPKNDVRWFFFTRTIDSWFLTENNISSFLIRICILCFFTKSDICQFLSKTNIFGNSITPH